MDVKMQQGSRACYNQAGFKENDLMVNPSTQK